METAAKSNDVILPAITLKSGSWKYKEKKIIGQQSTIDPPKQEVGIGCSLVYETGSSKIFFKIPDQKLYKKNGVINYTMLECEDVSAADLKITSKFSSWDTMSCRLLVECTHPLVAWETQNVVKVKENLQTENLNSTNVAEVSTTENQNQVLTRYIATPQESCMVKATFDLSYAPQLRDVLHSLKVSKLKERKELQVRQREGLDKDVQVPCKIREGLPEWVNYIPAKWYSSTVRKVIEYLMIIYTILTLAWAIWQLYKHVDFIRKYLRPILAIIEFYLEILKTWFRWLDMFAETLSVYWWTYMKPIYLLATPLYVALAQLFKPLRNVAGLVSVIFGPVVKSFQSFFTVLKPLMQSMSGVFGFVFQIFRKLFSSIAVVWNIIMNTTAAQFFIQRCNQLGITKIMHEITHGGLDPFKAQMIVIRDILTRSIKQIIYGIKFLLSRISYMYAFAKRERNYANEQANVTEPKEKEE